MQQAIQSLGTLNVNVSLTQTKMASLNASLLSLGAGFLSLRQGIHAIESLVQAGAKVETLKVSLASLFGSAEAGAQAFAFVQTQANRLGSDVIRLAENYKSLVSVTRETFLAGNQTDQMFLSLTNHSRALGLSISQENTLFTTFEGALSRGTIQSNQLTRGLQAIPGGLSLVARAIGVTVDQLRIMGTEQELISSIIVPRVIQLMQRELGDKALAAANTVETATNRMKNAWASVGDVIVKTGAPTAFIQSLEVAVKYWDEIFRKAQAYAALRPNNLPLALLTGADYDPAKAAHDARLAQGGFPSQQFQVPGQPDITLTRQGQAYDATVDQLKVARAIADQSAKNLEYIKQSQAETAKYIEAGSLQAKMQEFHLKGATADLAAQTAQVTALETKLAADKAELQKLLDFTAGAAKKQEEATAAQAQVTAATTAEATRYQNAINLQAGLNEKLREARELIAQTEEQIRQEPSTREEATKELVRQLDKIQKTLDFTRALNKDLLTLQPGPTTLAPPAGVDAQRFKAAAPFIQASSAQYGVAPTLATAVMIRESQLDPNAIGPRTRTGEHAQGIGQLMPGTAAGLGVTQPYDLAQGVSGSVRYLAQMLEKFSGNIDLALAAYNAGPGRVQEAGNRIPDIPETQAYVPAVKAIYAQLQAQATQTVTPYAAAPTGLDPAAVAKSAQLVALAAEEGITLAITSGFRTAEEQARLYAQGRTTPGNIVTNARPGTSRHESGLAFDVAPLNPQGQPDWQSPQWARIGELGKSLGLEWGGDWTSFKDRPHFQLPQASALRVAAPQLQGPTLESTPLGTPVTAPVSLQGPTLGGEPLGGQVVLDATKAGVDEARLALNKYKLEVVDFGNQTKNIKLFTDLQTELEKITELPDVFAANELERLNRIAETTQLLKIEFAKNPAAAAAGLKAAIQAMEEIVGQAFATFTLKQVRLKLDKEVDDLIGNLNLKAAQFRQQVPETNLGVQNPNAALRLGITRSELTGPAVPPFATTARLQEVSKYLEEIAKAEALGLDPAKINAFSYAVRDMITAQALASGKTFLQQLQDQYDLIVKLPAALQAEKLAREGVSAATIKQAEALREDIKLAGYAGQGADFLIKTVQDAASGDLFKGLGQSTQVAADKLKLADTKAQIAALQNQIPLIEQTPQGDRLRQQQIAQLQQLKNTYADLTASIADGVSKQETLFSRLAASFQKMVLSILLDASGLKTELTGLLTTGLKSLGGALGLGGAVGSTGAGVSAGSAAGIEGEGALFASGLAGGGEMLPGRFYTVGEAGRETVWSGQGGHVYNQEQMGKMAPVVNITVITPDATSFQRGTNEIYGKALRYLQQAQRAS